LDAGIIHGKSSDFDRTVKISREFLVNNLLKVGLLAFRPKTISSCPEVLRVLRICEQEKLSVFEGTAIEVNCDVVNGFDEICFIVLSLKILVKFVKSSFDSLKCILRISILDKRKLGK